MSKKNGKRKKQIHGDRLLTSSHDFGLFIEVVEVKFKEMIQAYMIRYGTMIDIPSNIKKAIVLWRKVLLRHRQGDLRHMESELKASNEAGQWVLDEYLKLRNQSKATFKHSEG